MDTDREVNPKLLDILFFLGFFLYIASFILPATQENNSDWFGEPIAGWEAFGVSLIIIFDMSGDWWLINFHILSLTNFIIAGAFFAIIKGNRVWQKRLLPIMVCSFFFMAGFYVWAEGIAGGGLIGYGYLVWASSFLIVSILLGLKLRPSHYRL